MINMLNRKCHGLLVSGAAPFGYTFPNKETLKHYSYSYNMHKESRQKFQGWHDRELKNHTVPDSIWQSKMDNSKTSHSPQVIKTQYLQTALKTCVIKYQYNGVPEMPGEAGL